MNKSRLLVHALTIMLTISCSEKRVTLLVESNLPFGAVEFDKIESTDYMPAFEEGCRFKAEIDSIAACPDAPTFNTIEALEGSGRLIACVGNVFFNLMESDADDIMKGREGHSWQTESSSYLYMNETLFNRVKTYMTTESSGLTVEQQKCLKILPLLCKRRALLDEEVKARFREIQNRLGELRVNFAENNKRATPITHVTDLKRLEGLPESQLEAAAAR